MSKDLKVYYKDRWRIYCGGKFKESVLFLIVSLFLPLMCAVGEPRFVQNGAWPLGLESDFSVPTDNPVTRSKVILGKRLFFDKRLSKDETVSCASCHDPAHGFSNGKTVGVGVLNLKGSRNVPSIINRLFGKSQFWDGRSETLESQALLPLLNPNEMAITEELLLEKLKKDIIYQKLFQDAFDTEPTLEGVGKAIASFERTLLSGSTPFDYYEWNGEKDVLSESAMRGLVLFRGKARCSTCHIGTNFTDENFHNLGSGEGEGQKDPGRAQVTKDSMDFGKFKTPTLRNITLTAPYMHDGSLETLEAVIEFYDQGGIPNPNLDEEVKPLELTDEEKADLLAFLKCLTGPVISVNIEELEAFTE